MSEPMDAYEYMKYARTCERCVQSAATRLNMDPVALAEDLQNGRIAEMIQTLIEAEEYFGDRATAEYLPDRAAPVGNEEMRFFTTIQGILATLPKPETPDPTEIQNEGC
jgi:hypothetical protein